MVGFFGLRPIVDAASSGGLNIQFLLSRDGIRAFITPVFPIMLFLEFVFLLFLNRRNLLVSYRAYKIPVMHKIAGSFLVSLISFSAFLYFYGVFSVYAPFDTGYHWYSYIYAYVVWEFSHFVYHFTCHKVRLLWCLHSPHHAPEHMNLSVIYTGFFLQGFYATTIRTSICALLGIPLPLLFFVMVIDSVWGAMIHIGEDMMPKGRLWFLYRFILTPSHHRIHHARNPQYIDKNYCNLLNVWDRVFGTYQEEVGGVHPEYGVTRKINANSFFDTYFGEFYLLIRDVLKAKSWKEKFLTVFMPPGWKPAPNGEHLSR